MFISGNKKTSDRDILNQVNLFPGQVLTLPDIDIAERKVSKLKGVKSAAVRVIDREGDSTYKDIEITVEEK